MDHILTLPFRLEILGLTFLGWLIIYFFVNRLKVKSQDRLDLGTAFDRKIPFVPQFALIYFSTYIFVVQPFIILSKANQFYWMLASFASISIIASLIHALVPSKIERRDNLDTGNLSGWLLGQFQKTCKPYGNFPSMHVGLSVPVVAANFLVGGVGIGSLSLLWAILIALSTLFTKQHYILDVLAGIFCGIVIFFLTFWLMLS
ncbi:MAG: phosphatase PAP2 family protein [Chloroflexi bacterium]|nr:phosphatase PAP2 family protein [Chloroflexota bacterium]